MKNDDLDFAVFDDYLEKRLSNKDKIEFEERLRNDQTFYEEYYKFRLLTEGIERFGRSKLLERLKDFENEIAISTTSHTNKFNLTYKWSAAAAACLLLLLAFLLLLTLSDKTAGEKLFAEHYSPYANYLRPSLRSESSLTHFSDSAFKAYDSSDFEKAFFYFEKMESAGYSSETAFYLGNAYLHTDQTDQATAQYKKVIESNQNFVAQAKWYLALTYLKVDKIEASKKLLRELKIEGKYHYKEAEAILQKIK